MLAIETQNLSRRFGSQQGVQNIDLQIPSGSIYGFLGPNGAGKTTTMRLLLGLLKPDSGHIALNGIALDNRRHALQRVGAMIESPSIYPHLTGRQNLQVTQRLLGLADTPITQSLHTVALNQDADRRAGDYSLGMKQRLGIAQALLQDPALLILDEPSNGLDPEGILQMRDLLKHLSVERGISVMISSHQLSEIEQIADHIGLIVDGKLRFQGTLHALQSQHQPRLRIECEPLDYAISLLKQNGLHIHLINNAIEIDCPPQTTAEINRVLVAAGIAVFGLSHVSATLESLFFSLTKSTQGSATP